MKILLVGESYIHGRLNSYRKAFQRLGHEVHVCPLEDHFKVSLLNRAINRLFKVPIYFGVGPINSVIIETAAKLKPDFILFFKPNFITPKTLLTLKYKGIKVFSWHPDDVLNPKNISKNFLKTAPLFDHHFFIKKYASYELIMLGIKKDSFTFLPHAVDKECHHPVTVSSADISELGADVVFVGTYANDLRAEYLEKLCLDGFNIKIYGNGWWKHPSKSCLRRKKCIQFKTVYCKDLSKVLNSSKIVLAFLRKDNKATQTARTYEIPACGAFMLHERTPEVASIFKEGQEAEFFNSYNELKKKINFYLKHDKLRKQVAERGYKKIIGPDYSYEQRASRIIEVYSLLI